MKCWTKCILGLASGLIIGVGWPATAARGDEPAKKPAEGVLVVVDQAGKEHQLKTWKFVAGTRHLSWLAAEAAAKDDKGKAGPAKDAGPEALEFTEGKGPPLKKGVLTLVPLERIRALEYDNVKKTVVLRIAGAEDKDVVIEGVTGYVGINVLGIEAQADLGELGQATVKFQGGVSRGVRSIRFPSPKPAAAAPAGRRDEVTVHRNKDKIVHRIVGLQPLYQLSDGALRVMPTLLFQKTVKLDPAKIEKMSQVGAEANTNGLVFEVTLKEGQRHPLVLIERLDQAKAKPAFLQGLIGRTEVGYKLFPMHVVDEACFDCPARDNADKKP